MNSKLGVIVLVALQAYTIWAAGRPCVCGRDFNAVCGSDGVTYSNECKLECEKRTAKYLTKASDGPCPSSEVPASCVCPFIFKPVCGSDGVTYSNDCALRCQQETKPGIRIAYEGACDDKIPRCICPDNIKEVCGSDGKTYANDCLLNCATAHDNTLGIKHAGKCDTDNVVETCDLSPPSCTCTRDYKPVCGSDCKTYPNDCLLNCATAKDPTLRIAKEGKCETDVKIPPSCTCERDLKPVCGSDGKTYSNDCLLNCATANDHTLRIAKQGKCETQYLPHCTCPEIFKPVCGSDGKTYDNDCLLNCATAQDNTLSIKHPGECYTVKVVNPALPPPCTCRKNVDPVCGSDGKTYSNDCVLNCATAKDHTLSIKHAGKCEQVNVVNNAPTGCTCYRNFEPVCGSNGVTYNNMCLLECAGQTVAKQGEC